MNKIIRPLLILIALLLPALPAGAELARDRLTVETAKGGSHDFEVEIARTHAEQARGLMYRESLAEDAGMLFLYDEPQPLSFWMKNTLIPLDIIFIGRDGRILNIVTAKPLDLTPVSSEGRGTAVLEINGGLAAKLGIAAGDRVVHPHFGTDAR
ncbi:DUF192 domain-containing protein [Indioceanicola profundi]|uniref:DUF192 domain-containing protein n=1 Tax=Indioceanicola profundi TaxID=2220096 RepID=UPI000E6AB503|nr:DUF192 domain-containing protein [Indioceanicola profundi]